MQSKSSRVALIVAAAAIAVVAFVVLAPSDEDGEDAPAVGEEAEEAREEDGSQEDARGRPEAGPGDGGRQGDEPAPIEAPVIQIEDGDVRGGVETIEVEQGERIEFAVESDAPDEIHVHGYEITRDVEPRKPLLLSFPADLDGIYEVEAHDIGHVVIAELRVTP